jgi:hypothetical protein
MSNRSGVSRRSFLSTTTRLAGITAAIGIAPQFIRPSRARAVDALAPGMIGGPTGFAGAERYQYGADTPEGRAIEAAKSLKAAGKAPEKIVLGLSDGSIGQLTQPFPERRTLDQGSVGSRNRHQDRNRRPAERSGIHQDHAGHLHQERRLRHLFGRMEPLG